MAVRLDEGAHAQLRFIAQLRGNSIADEIRRSIEDRINAAQDDADLIARAQEARQEIEREAAARTAAIAGFIGQTVTSPPAAKTAAKPPRARRQSEARSE
ncbi:hypothetical protein ISG29_17695 [Nocardioides sp. CBS4Y-1]|uniref:Uncharacterized protein n=1 Tax=Nocardioides acrostichi TaxID=2784339 RepID=A0A930Y8X3_9ACTN|nr:hypothetical protein [Nocardioides acrostichi]